MWDIWNAFKCVFIWPHWAKWRVDTILLVGKFLSLCGDQAEVTSARKFQIYTIKLRDEIHNKEWTRRMTLKSTQFSKQIKQAEYNWEHDKVFSISTRLALASVLGPFDTFAEIHSTHPGAWMHYSRFQSLVPTPVVNPDSSPPVQSPVHIYHPWKP